MDFLLPLILNLIITMFAYLLIPIIIALRGKVYDDKKLKKIIFINGVTVWFLFSIIRIQAGITENYNFAPALLWSSLGLWILKRKCLKDTSSCNDNSEEQSNYRNHFTTINSKKERYCKYCGTLIDDSSKQCTGCGKQYFKGLRLSQYVAIFLIIVLIILNIAQYTAGLELKNELSDFREGKIYADEYGDIIKR